MENENQIQDTDSVIGGRIFKRNEKYIIMFWNLIDLSEDQKKNVVLSVKQQDKWMPLIFTQMDAAELNKDKKETAVAVINHEENKLNPKYNYLIRVSLGTSPTLKQAFIKITPYDELPPDDRDEKARRIHLMGWNTEKRRWTRINLVKDKDGSWVLPIKIVE